MSDEEEDRFFAAARDDMFPKMRDSSLVISLVSSDPDPKLCMELGAALLFDKPILLVTIGDRFQVPERVRRLAAEHVHLEDGEQIGSGSGGDRIAAAVKAMLGSR